MKSIEGIGDVFGAVAGLSMGGLGAMLYAAHSPHLFRAAASFSGVLDTLSTTDWQFPPEAWGNRTQQAKVWRQHNPTDRAADLRGISLFVSYGNGDPGPLDAAKTATSGVGGQIDFLRGAALSEGGKPILALASTAAEGTISRIVPVLQPGAGVTTSRAHVHFVATEFGVTNLHGLDLGERAQALIALAHPTFRDKLERAARELHYL